MPTWIHQQWLQVVNSLATLAACTAVTTAMAEERNNLALGKPVTASSVKWSKVEEAVDGNEFQGSRWTSDFPRDASRDHTQWLSVDLEQEHTIDKVRILWQRARWASDYKIQVSKDEQNWQTVWSVTDAKADGWRHEIKFDPVSARYVRLHCTRTANSLRDRPGVSKYINMYSVIEFEVYPLGVSMDPLRFAGKSTGKPTKASYERDNQYSRSRQVNDGLMTTFWSAKPTTEQHWISLDLEATSTIKEFVLHWHKTPVKYSVEISENSRDWTTIARPADMTVEPVEDEEVTETHRLKLEPQPRGRHIKVAIEGPPKSKEDTSYILQEFVVDFE